MVFARHYEYLIDHLRPHTYTKVFSNSIKRAISQIYGHWLKNKHSVSKETKDYGHKQEEAFDVFDNLHQEYWINWCLGEEAEPVEQFEPHGCLYCENQEVILDHIMTVKLSKVENMDHLIKVDVGNA